MMKSVLRNLLLTCGLGASLHGVASAGAALVFTPPETFADGSMFFVDTATQTPTWYDAKDNADYLLSSDIGSFAAIRTKAESDAVFDLIGQFIALDPGFTLNDRYYFGLKYVVDVIPANSGWSWVSGDPTYNVSGLFVSPFASPTHVAFPWGAGYRNAPNGNAGAYIACNALSKADCNSSTLEWRYDEAIAPSTTAQGWTVIQTPVPLPATLGIVLAGLIGMAGLRRART